MFDDKRSKRVILVAHRILNQNAKIDRCAHYPGAVREAAQMLIDSGVGIIQMPCPELICLGLDRQADREEHATIEAEDTRVARRMIEEPAQTLCHKLAADLVLQVEEYRKNGFQAAGILGVNGSPTCGVETNWREDEEAHGPGVFIQILTDLCHRTGLSLPTRGVKAYEPQAAAAAVAELLSTPGEKHNQ
jgi:predicted secreted protein